MRKRAGLVCVLLGGALLLVALVLYGYNRYEDQHAAEQAQTVLQDLQQQIAPLTEQDTQEPVDLEQLQDEMPVMEIDGVEYMGYLEIPDIELSLPVQSEWSYAKLKKTPCRECGSARTNDLVIAAHNYASHFGKLGTLSNGAQVLLTDMDNIRYTYTVDKIVILEPTETAAVRESDYDLVLYTCTYGGKTRIVVYCSQTSVEHAEAA